MDFIKKYTTSNEIYLFLEDKLSQLENSEEREQEKYLKELPIDEKTLLIHLMYIGRGDQDEKEYYKENFYIGYKSSHNQWKNDRYLVSQMLGKMQFLDYLKNAKKKYSKNFFLK